MEFWVWGFRLRFVCDDGEYHDDDDDDDDDEYLAFRYCFCGTTL